MNAHESLAPSVAQYVSLTHQLKSEFVAIDDETLHDTLEGVCTLPDLLQAIVRSSLEDGLLVTGLRARLEEMQERLARLRERQEKKRALVSSAMHAAGIPRLQAPDFTVSIRAGAQAVEVTDEALIPSEFYIHQAPRLDRAGLASALRRGTRIDGATLVTGEPTITVRVR